MRQVRIVSPLLMAGALLAGVIGAQTLAEAQTQALVDGRQWQQSSLDQRRAYLVGVSNVISVGARYDPRHAPAGADTFAVRSQRGLQGARMEPAIAAVDAWYKAHPDKLDTPVLSVVWREVANQPPPQIK